MPVDIEAGLIPPHGCLTVDTGVHMKIPDGYVGMIKSKSGLNVKHGIRAEGVIDAGYTGSIVVKLHNDTGKNYTFYPEEKITQIVILPIPKTELRLVGSFDEDTERGADGFGSSGRF
jgi:dUTP pyrophosphatase